VAKSKGVAGIRKCQTWFSKDKLRTQSRGGRRVEKNKKVVSTGGGHKVCPRGGGGGQKTTRLTQGSKRFGGWPKGELVPGQIKFLVEKKVKTWGERLAGGMWGNKGFLKWPKGMKGMTGPNHHSEKGGKGEKKKKTMGVKKTQTHLGEKGNGGKEGGGNVQPLER